MKTIKVLLVVIFGILLFVPKLSALNFWTKYSDLSDEMIVVCVAGDDLAAYVSKDNKLYLGKNTILVIPDKDAVFNSVEFNYNYSNKLFVGTDNFGVWAYNLKEQNWTEFNNNLTDTYAKILFCNEKWVFIKTSDGKIWRSLTDSSNWEDITKGLEAINVLALYDFAAYPEIFRYSILAGTEGHGVYRFDENSLKWFPMNFGIENETVTSFAMGNDENGHFYGNWIATNSGAYLLKSAKNQQGYIWVKYNNGLDNTNLSKITGTNVGYTIIDFFGFDNFPTIPDFNLFSIDNEGIFYYQEIFNKEINWISDTTGLNGAKINDIAYLPLDYDDKLFAATDNGIYVSNSNRIYTSVKDNNNEILIYPNPAGDYIIIDFGKYNGASPIASEIKIYNVLGNVVNTPSPNVFGNSPLNEGNLKLDISQLPAGMYFVRIKDKVLSFVKE